jgi:hypothetical protein
LTALVARDVTIEIPAVVEDTEDFNAIRDNPIDKEMSRRLDAAAGDVISAVR